MPSAATWMDLEIVILSQISQTEKDQYNMIHAESKKHNTNELIYKIEADSQTDRLNLWLLGGSVVGVGWVENWY